MSNRKSLVLRGVAECVTEEELDKLLSNKNNPKAYIGFEPSGAVQTRLCSELHDTQRSWFQSNDVCI